MKADVKMLIKEGRLEITMGGWVGADEDDANYEDLIGNFQKGHKWILDEFNTTARVGWNVDPFGHTEGNAALFHDFGFDALFFSRSNAKNVKDRWANRGSHFLWRPFSNHFGKQKEILTGLISDGVQGYGYNKGFTYDDDTDAGQNDEDTGIQDDPTLAGFNAEALIARLVNQVHVVANGTASNENVMYLYGDDFSWSNAYALYNNLEKMIKYGNLYNKHNITFVMSTPSRYVDAL